MVFPPKVGGWSMCLLYVCTPQSGKLICIFQLDSFLNGNISIVELFSDIFYCTPLCLPVELDTTGKFPQILLLFLIGKLWEPENIKS